MLLCRVLCPQHMLHTAKKKKKQQHNLFYSQCTLISREKKKKRKKKIIRTHTAHTLHTQTLPASAVGGARDSWWGRTCPFPGEGFPLVASLHVFALHRRPLKHANVYNACHALTPLEDKGREGKNGRTKQNRSL